MEKYQIIYADPPWSYYSGKVEGAARNHYETMEDTEIYQLPIEKIADKLCIVFMGNIPETSRGTGNN